MSERSPSHKKQVEEMDEFELSHMDSKLSGHIESIR